MLDLAHGTLTAQPLLPLASSLATAGAAAAAARARQDTPLWRSAELDTQFGQARGACERACGWLEGRWLGGQQPALFFGLQASLPTRPSSAAVHQERLQYLLVPA